MKKMFLGMMVVLFAALLAPQASADPAWVLLETLTVDSADSVGETSATVLEDGWLYRFEVSGTFTAGDNIEADVDYSFRTGSSTIWTDSVSNYESYGDTLLDMQVNGASLDWGPYNASHVYTTNFVGEGDTVDFVIYDIHYPSNSGSLTVKIFATPVMVSTTISEPATVDVGAEEEWNIQITVEAKYADVTGVIVQDGMGADLDGIVLGTPSAGTASMAIKGKGKMGATMVTWNVGDLDAGDSATLVVTVTTGYNPKDKHEFTSAGEDHALDGGASADYWCGDPAEEYQSPKTDPVTVDVVEPVAP